MALRVAKPNTGLRALPARRVAVRVQASAQAAPIKQAAAAAALSAALLVGGCAIAPEEALAASSGGRVSSNGFAARRQAAAPAANKTTVINNTTVVAPPVVASPFGFGGFGFGFGMPVFMPVVPFSGILSFMALMLVVSLVFNLAQGAISAASSAGKKNDRGDYDSL